MFTAILSRTWWSSLKKGESSRPAEGQSRDEDTDLGQPRDQESDEPIELEGAAIATDDQLDDALESDGESDRQDSSAPQGRGRNGRRGRGRRGDRRNERSEDTYQADAARDDEHGDEDEVDTHLGEDPLAPAFELDDERPSRGRKGGGEGRAPVIKTRVQSAKEFFTTELLYRFDLLEPHLREKMAGSYRLEVKGNRGGIWTMNIGNELEVVNRREEADVVLAFQHRDFVAIVNGDINPQLSVLAQKMKYTGDVKKVVQVQALLSPMAE